LSQSPERKKLSVTRSAASKRDGADASSPKSGPRARRATDFQRSQARQAPAAETERPQPGRDQRPDRPPRPERAPRSERPQHAEPTAAQRPEPRRRERVAGQRYTENEAIRAQHSTAETFPVFAPCPQGLEAVLVDELHELGFDDAHPGRAGAHFSTDWRGVMQANLHSRIATRILVRVAQAPVQTEDELYQLALETPWEQWFGAEQTLRVDTSAIRSPMQSLQFCNLKVKDGICDRLREREGERPSIDTVRPDARVHAFLTEDQATLYLDTSGESLFKRGWRLDKGEAPLRENLAAGMLALSGWPANRPIIDPFCGSGTILIEAALLALRVPPGISRPFSFERLRQHPQRLWHDLKDEARTRILPELPMQLAGADIDPASIEAARRNAERAGLTEEAVYFEVADARDTCPLDDQPGWIISNPPYGERLDATQDPLLWQEWSQTLKREFGGWQAHLISSDMELPQKLRLKPSRRVPLYNGALECRLFRFDLASGSFRKP